MNHTPPSTESPSTDVAMVVSMKYGLTQFMLRDVKALIARGHRVRLFTLLNSPGPYMPPADCDVTDASAVRAVAALAMLLVRRPGLGIRLLRHAFRFGTLRDLSIAAQWAPTVKSADVVFSYFGDHKLFVGYYCKRITGKPLVVTVRAYELHRNPNERMFVEALQACDRVLTITDYNRRALIERFRVPPDRIKVVRQVVELEVFRNMPKVKILIVAYFAEKKGYDILLEALKMMDRDDVELWIVGDRTPSVLGVDVRQMVEEIGLGDRVALFGSQSGVSLRALYRECDVFCLPSRTDRKGDKEGFPNVIAEAMAFSKPVVSTRHAGIPEAIDVTLIDEGDAGQLVHALNAIIDSPKRRELEGVANRRRAEAMFSEANSDLLAKMLVETSGFVAESPHGLVSDNQTARES